MCLPYYETDKTAYNRLEIIIDRKKKNYICALKVHILLFDKDSVGGSLTQDLGSCGDDMAVARTCLANIYRQPHYYRANVRGFSRTHTPPTYSTTPGHHPTPRLSLLDLFFFFSIITTLSVSLILTSVYFREN